jgi:hypothetical protein
MAKRTQSGPGPAPRKAAPDTYAASRSEYRQVRRAEIARRLKEIRQQLHGDHGGAEFARRLGLPAGTWYGYEKGTTLPAEVLFDFIDLTSANPMYVLDGKEPIYKSSDER